MAPKNKKSMVSSVLVTDVVCELNQATELLQAQVDVGMSREEILGSMFAGLLQRTGQLDAASSAEKTQLSNAIALGPWDDDQKKELARAIMGASLAHVSTSASGMRRKNQSCLNLENWLREIVWVGLKQHLQHPRASWSSLLAAAMVGFGVEIPCERTLYRGGRDSELL